MKACITILGSDIICSNETLYKKEYRISFSDNTLKILKDWSQRYDRAVLSGDPAPLIPLGIEIFPSASMAWTDIS